MQRFKNTGTGMIFFARTHMPPRGTEKLGFFCLTACADSRSYNRDNLTGPPFIAWKAIQWTLRQRYVALQEIL